METKNIYQKLFDLKQKELVLKKDTEGYGYNYATLKQIQEKLNPILKDLQLVIIHSIKNNEVITRLQNIEKDDYVESSIEIGEIKTTRTETFVDKNQKDVIITDENTRDPQGVGSAISYARRYNLLALLDLEQEDDDGVKGSNRAKSKTYTTAPLYEMTIKDVEELWNGKIYGKCVYLNGEEKTISDEQIAKLKAHEKYIELPPKK